MTRILTCVLIASSLAACGVNEFDKYRDEIGTVMVQSQLPLKAELDIADVPIVGEPGPPSAADAAVAATESYILTRFNDTLYDAAAPDALARTFEAVFGRDVAQGTRWEVVAGGDFDARIRGIVDGYGIRIDELGRATAYFRMKAKTWATIDGRLIYDDFSSHAVPLTGAPGGPDPAVDPIAFAAERAYNLQILNDLTPRELRSMVDQAAAEAAATLARELVNAAF